VFKDKNSIYIIAFALAGLLSMQGMWVYYAVKQEKRFLNTNTRQAAIESISLLEQKEDSRILIKSLDTILNLPDEKHLGENIKLIFKHDKKKGKIVNSEDEKIITSYSYSENGNSQTNVRIIKTIKDISINARDSGKSKDKLKDYEHLLKKIVFQSESKNLNIRERINFDDLVKSVQSNLLTRGIEIKPEFAIKDKAGKIIFKTKSYSSGEGIQLPLFPKDIVFQNYTLSVFYPSTLNYILRRSIGVIVLSLLVTILLVTVILLLYKKMLTEKKLNQFKSDFINNLTHELKTPLATISLANANIAGSINNNTLHVLSYTAIIDEESKKLNEQIEKVFELSLLEKEKQIFNFTIINIHDAIKESLAQNSLVINTKQTIVNLALNATNNILKVDKFHFINVISNLVSNAIKYNETTAVIDVSTKNDSDKIIITVKDNGIGISKEHQKYIFDKFFRVTHKDLHATKGFGVGLSYAKQTIELFGGTLNVISEELKGSEFIIAIPYVKS
jgi:two-component system phosphate regulon sensor histidine kinase PhoR